MPIINGVDFNNLVSLSGVPKSSITNISGVAISQAPSCTTTQFGYSDGRRNPPEQSCLETPQDYDYDGLNNLLYVSGGCGTVFAVAGYYSDGRTIYFWDGASSFTPFSACGR